MQSVSFDACSMEGTLQFKLPASVAPQFPVHQDLVFFAALPHPITPGHHANPSLALPAASCGSSLSCVLAWCPQLPLRLCWLAGRAQWVQVYGHLYYTQYLLRQGTRGTGDVFAESLSLSWGNPSVLVLLSPPPLTCHLAELKIDPGSSE